MRNFCILLLLAAGLVLALCLNGGSQRAPSGSNSQMPTPESEPENGDAAKSPDTVTERFESGAELTSRVRQQTPPSGREVADETTSVPAASDGSDALISCPGEVMPAFRSLRRMCAERKVEIAAEIRLTAREWESLRASVNRFEAELREVELARALVLSEITDSKIATGDYEIFPHPDGEADPERRQAVYKALAEARRPTRPGQVVLKHGRNRQQLITRTQPEDYPALARLHEVRSQLCDDLVAAITLAIAHRL